MKKIFSIIIFFLSAVNVFSQTGWQRISPQPTEYRLIKIISTEDGTLFGIASSGSVIRSTNDGQTWDEKFNVNGIYKFNHIYFLNNNTGWILSENGEIIKTTDKGETWFNQESYTYFSLNHMSFINDQTGFICGRGGTVLRTTNGGNSWYFIGLKSPTTEFTSVAFFDNNTGYVFGSYYSLPFPIFPIMYKTTNAGVSWQVDSLNNFKWYQSIHYINSNTMIASGLKGVWPYNLNNKSVVIKTTDKGINWFDITPDTSMHSLEFTVRENNCWQFLLNYDSQIKKVYKSTNLGGTWQFVNEFHYDMKYISQSPNGKYWYSESLDILKSVDNGLNWTNISKQSVPSGSKLKFINDFTGFTLGDSSLLKTINGGYNWTHSNGYTPSWRSDFLPIDEKQVIATRGDTINNLFISIDGGLNFSSVPIGFSAYLFKIDFNNNVIRITYSQKLAGSNEHAYGYIESSDLGNTWIKKTQPEWILPFGYNYARYVKYFNETGFLITYKKILRTTNSGKNWSTSLTNDSNTFSFGNLSFHNSNTGWVLGNNSKIYKTINGGTTWDSTNLNGYGQFYSHDIQFINSNTGWITANFRDDVNWYNGRPGLLKTTDGGAIWKRFLFNNFGTYPKISMINENTGYVNYGALYKTTDGGTIGINSITHNSPEEFSLYQNYPNPFNPSTVINYLLKSKSKVELNVFDITGKKIITLVNEVQSAGSYNMTFNASRYNLSSGVYFYTLSTEKFFQSRKMILIK